MVLTLHTHTHIHIYTYMHIYTQEDVGPCEELPRTVARHSLYMPSCVNVNILCPHVQKITYYAHKYTHMHHFTHAHDTGGFQQHIMPKCVHVCSEWVLLGKAETTLEPVCWCWVSMRQ